MASQKIKANWLVHLSPNFAGNCQQHPTSICRCETCRWQACHPYYSFLLCTLYKDMPEHKDSKCGIQFVFPSTRLRNINLSFCYYMTNCDFITVIMFCPYNPPPLSTTALGEPWPPQQPVSIALCLSSSPSTASSS